MIKKCAICRLKFKVREDANTFATRQLCKLCRVALKKMKGREVEL